MSQALTVHVPAVLPKGVTKRQWRLAALLPRCETAAEALRLAGYSALTAQRNGYRQVGLIGVKRAQAAIEDRDRARRDKAREVHDLAGALVATRLDTMQDAAVVATWKTSADIIASGIGADNVVESELGLDWYKRQRRRALLRAYAAGQRNAIPPPTTMMRVESNDDATHASQHACTDACGAHDGQHEYR